MLQMLYDKWWKEYGDAGQCDAAAGDEKGRAKDANALAIDNVGGVFVVLAVGLALSPFVAAIEFVWKMRRHRGGECSWSPSIRSVKMMNLIDDVQKAFYGVRMNERLHNSFCRRRWGYISA